MPSRRLSLAGDRLIGSRDAPRAKTRPRNRAMRVVSLDHLVLTVRSIEATSAFYAGVLGVVLHRRCARHGEETGEAFRSQTFRHASGVEYESLAVSDCLSGIIFRIAAHPERC